MALIKPNVEWLTCLTGQFGASIGGGTNTVLYFQFAHNPGPGVVPLMPIPFDCKIVAMCVTYLSDAANPLVFTDGALEFSIGQVHRGSPAVATSFQAYPVLNNAPQITWGSEVNGTQPSTINNTLDIDITAGTLLCAKSLETGTILTGSSAEVSASIWLRGSTPYNTFPAPS